MNKVQLETCVEFFPGTSWKTLPNTSIDYRLYKHWGMNVYAGEKEEIHNGDRSGCLRKHAEYPFSVCAIPTVVVAYVYVQGSKHISCVMSYPNGIGLEDSYFWEIYDFETDIERYFTEKEAETRIIELLSTAEQP